MTAKQMERFTQHCDKCFRQKNDRVLHSAAMNDLHHQRPAQACHVRAAELLAVW